MAGLKLVRLTQGVVAAMAVAFAAADGGSPAGVGKPMEPGSQAGMERAVNAEDATKGAASKKPDPRSRKVKHRSEKAKQEAGEAAGAGGSTDRAP